MFLHLALTLTQIDTVVEIAADNGAITVGTFIAALASIILMMARIFGSAIAKRFKEKQKLDSQRDSYELEVDKQEDALSIEAKAFIAEQARESMQSIRTIAEECRKEVRELREEKDANIAEISSLKADNRSLTGRITTMTNELNEQRSNLTWTKDALASSQAEMTHMQAQINLLKREIAKLQNHTADVEMANSRLEKELIIVKTKLEDREGELITQRRDNEQLVSKIGKLRQKLIEYRQERGNMSDLDTNELLGLKGDDPDEQ